MEQLKQYIRSVPDFPKAGINFYDITTLFLDPIGFGLALDAMETYARSKRPDKLVAIEARGFVFGAALADRLKIGLILARKSGKLPSKTVAEEYTLEYGTDRLEIHTDAICHGDRVIVVDDLLATGGTLSAACRLVEHVGGQVVGISVVIALNFLPFRSRLAGYDISFLVSYDSE